MHVLSFNIHQGLDWRNEPVLERMAEAIATRRADVVACQEVLDGDAPELQDQAGRLAAHLGMQATFVPNARVGRGALGNATFTRRAVDRVENVDLSLEGFERRGALRLEVDGIAIWNVHLGLTRSQRSNQWRTLLAALEADPLPSLVCGDFNDWSGDIERSARRHGGLQDALEGVRRRRRSTFPARFPVFRLDRVYTIGCSIRQARVLSGRPWSRLSDHLPVEVVLERDDSVIGPGPGEEAGS